MALFGIDISKWNGELNFAAVKNAGVRFAMVKASQGHALSSEHYLFTDSRFEENITGLAKAGIPAGAYHFFTASNEEEAIREAEFFLSVCEPYREQISLYLACDAENYGNPWLEGLTPAALSHLIAVFCKRVEDAGFSACHYTNTDHIRYHIDLDAIPYPVWHAHYPTRGSLTKPLDAGEKLAIHQYTDAGQLLGVPGKFDLNFGYAPLAKMIIQARTSIEDQTIDFILRLHDGESILTRLADRLAVRTLRPVKDESPEHLRAVIRYHCGLKPTEIAALSEYRWAKELFAKLYAGMQG